MKIYKCLKLLIPTVGLGFLSIGAILSTTSCSQNKVQYVMHRGLSSRYFENTAKAFEEAGKAKST
jgi:glycerophosphoryl diester phosphodiesterase